MTADLIAFLNARFDEDEQAAQAATPGPWWYDPGKQWLNPEAFERYNLARGEEFVGYGGPSPFTGAVAATGPASHPQSMADAAFIARHDPARVLREVKAKRRIIAELWDSEEDFPTEHTASGTAEAVLRLLALPYSDHDDFDPAWSTE